MDNQVHVHTKFIHALYMFNLGRGNLDQHFSTSIYLLRLTKEIGNPWTMCEICSNLILKATERHLYIPWKHLKARGFLIFSWVIMTSFYDVFVFSLIRFYLLFFCSDFDFEHVIVGVLLHYGGTFFLTKNKLLLEEMYSYMGAYGKFELWASEHRILVQWSFLYKF